MLVLRDHGNFGAFSKNPTNTFSDLCCKRLKLIILMLSCCVNLCVQELQLLSVLKVAYLTDLTQLKDMTAITVEVRPLGTGHCSLV